MLNEPHEDNVAKVLPRNANKLRWGNLMGKIALRKIAEYIQVDFGKCKHDIWI